MARTSRLALGILVVAGDALVFAACDAVEREDNPRYYIPPPPDATPDAVVTPPVDDTGAPDAAVDADADAGTTWPLIATGAGFHPDPTIGSGDHTCMIAGGAARGVWCWGANDRGQLGLGTTGDGGTIVGDVATAMHIDADETGLPFDAIDELALGPWHSCARRADVLFCWGQRFSGAQAEPPSATAPERTRPRAVGNVDVARIAAGGPHTCVLKANGKHVCFGHSAFGELGRPATADLACLAPIFYAYNGLLTHSCSGTLVESTAITIGYAATPSALAITAGETHSCALVGDHVACWGTNVAGELGRPGVQPVEPVPQVVVTNPTTLAPLDGVSMLASGGKHSCALRAGTVFCWGSNDAGQLGVPSTLTSRAHAEAVAGITNAIAIGVAERVSCAVRADKSVVCWGADVTSLPDGGAIVSTPTPTQVKGAGGAGFLMDVDSVAPGFRHVCVRKTDGSAWCWGKNDRGQLGDGTKVDSPYPVKVVGIP